MNVVDLIERREFKQIYRNVKRKKLKPFLFCFSRFRNLYKGKISKYLDKIWDKIVSETKDCYQVENFDFVNFQYVYEFIKSRLPQFDEQESNEQKYDQLRSLQKWYEENCGNYSLAIIDENEKTEENEKTDKTDRNKKIVDLFLTQLIHILKYHIITKRSYHEAFKKNIKKNEQKCAENESDTIYGNHASLSPTSPFSYSPYENLTTVTENNEFEILFNIIHPYISNTYITILMNEKLPIPVNNTEVFLQYIIYSVYNIYRKNRNVLFYYFLIYKQIKKIRKNILNTQNMVKELEISQLIKKNMKKIINAFQILRTYLLNIADSVTIYKFTRYICTFLYKSTVERGTKSAQKRFQRNYIAYKPKENFYEFCFFIYLLIEDLCEEKAAEHFNFNYLKIKKFFKTEQNIIFDLYLFIHFINAGTCDPALKARLMLLSFIKWVSLSVQIDETQKEHTEGVRNGEGDNVPSNEEQTMDAFELSLYKQTKDGQEEEEWEIEKEEKREQQGQMNDKDGKWKGEKERKITQEEFLKQMKYDGKLINEYLQIEKFYQLSFVLKYMSICFYNLINHKKESYIKYDHIDEEEEEEKKKEKMNEEKPNEQIFSKEKPRTKEKRKEHLFENYSSMTYSSNYVSINVEKKIGTRHICTTTHMAATTHMLAMVSVLIHLQLIRLDDIWSFTLSNCLVNNFFFQLLNLLNLRNKPFLLRLTISAFLKCHYIWVSNFMYRLALERRFNNEHFLTENVHHQNTKKGVPIQLPLQRQLQGQVEDVTEEEEEEEEEAETTMRHYNTIYKHPAMEQFFYSLQCLRKEIKEFSKNETRVLFLLSCLSLHLSKYMLRLPLIVWKFLFKQILKFLVKPIHDVKMSIEVFFQNSCLRVAHYIFELICAISIYIHYVTQKIENQEEYYKKYTIFPFFFNFVDIYVRFAEKYNRHNNTCLMSFLDIPFTQLFLLMFDYSSTAQFLVTSAHNSHLLDERPSFYCTSSNRSSSNESQNFRFTKKYMQYYLTKCQHNIYKNVRHDGSEWEHHPSEEYVAVKQMFSFLEKNNNIVNCYIYTLLMYVIGAVHLSNHYRIREMNYIAFLHILPWKCILHFCVNNSLLSSYFFQKFYEIVHYLLPEMDVEQAGTELYLHFQARAQSEVEKTEELKKYIHYMNIYDDSSEKTKRISKEIEKGKKEHKETQAVHGDSDSDDSEEERKCEQFMYLDLDQLNVYEQITVAKTFVKMIFFSKKKKRQLVDIIYLNKVCKHNIFRSILLLLTFLQIKFLKTKDRRKYKINDVISFLTDKRIGAYYISLFQNPMNFLLNCSERFVKLLIRQDCMDGIIALIFAKFQNYLSLVPPQTNKQVALPIAVEDIAVLQETAVSQFVVNLEGDQKTSVDVEAKKGEKEKTKKPLETGTKCTQGKEQTASGSARTRQKASPKSKKLYDDTEKKKNKQKEKEVKSSIQKGKKKEFIFNDSSFFFKKMKGLVNSFSPETWNNICESGFNLHNSFYLSFYLSPSVFSNIFSYYSNNIMAIGNSGYNLDDNIQFYKSVNINENQYSLKPFNVIDKTVFYAQLIVFYLIINLNNEALNIANYSVQFHENFNKCLEAHMKEHVDKLIISLMPIMLQFFYFFPTMIPSTLILLNQLPQLNNEFTTKSTSFIRSLKNIMESAYCNEKK